MSTLGWLSLAVEKSLALLGGDGRVGFDQLGHHTAHGLNTERKRGDVQEQNILHVATQDTALDGSAHSHYFVRVHPF